MFVVITWEPRNRVRGNLLLRVYSQPNTLVSESKAKKVDFRPGRDSGITTEFALPVPQSAGAYRAELVLDENVMWRRGFAVR